MSTKQTNPKDAVGTHKAPMSTVPAVVIAELGLCMLEGALKYGRHNYRASGVRASIYYDAALRHLIDWWEGTDVDKDSGLSHVAKAISALVVLRDSMIRGNWTDDRPPKCAPFYEELNDKAKALIERYGHIQPTHYTQADFTIATGSELTDTIAKHGLGHEAVSEAVSKVNDGGWIHWMGGENPAGESLVEYKLAECGDDIFQYHASGLRWQHLGRDNDIIAYRILEE